MGPLQGRLAGGARGIRNAGVARNLCEGKPTRVLVWRRSRFSIVPESEFAFSSVRFPSLTLNSGVARMPLGRKVPSDELKSSKELVEERFTRFGYETPVAVQQRRTGLIESEREPTNDQRVSAGAQRGQLLNSDPRQR